MLKTIEFNDFVIKVGDKFRAKEGSSTPDGCTENCTVRVEYITGSGLIGLYSECLIEGWGDLDGRVKYGHGFFIQEDYLCKYFRPFKTEFTIQKAIKHKGHNLQGMKCKLIKSLRHTQHVFVEVDKNIGAGGADGLGKLGHCILITKDNLSSIPPEKKKSKNQKIFN